MESNLEGVKTTSDCDAMEHLNKQLNMSLQERWRTLKETAFAAYLSAVPMKEKTKWRRKQTVCL